jgi:predicted transcriptional regulator of viral defense system
MMQTSRIKQAYDLVRKVRILRPRDLDTHGIPREYLIRLFRKGLVNRVGRGLYTPLHADVSEHYNFAEACKKIPAGVICLFSALRFHSLTTQAPSEVWIAIDGKARHPRESGLPIRVVRFSGDALHAGIEEHIIEGVKVRVYNPAKTVADCFKYRNKIGLDVALEALKESWRERRCTMDQLWYYAKICRVANIMRPYLESLT